MPEIYYSCPDCGSTDERFHHRRDAAAETLPCRGFRFKEAEKQRVERRVPQADGTELIEYEEVELEPEIEICAGTMRQTQTFPGETVALNAKRFEEMVVFEVVDYDRKAPDWKRSHQQFYVPGRNWEPTEPGMVRHEITNISEYNRLVKRVNTIETQKMRDHRDMHRHYFETRRAKMREHYDDRRENLPQLRDIREQLREFARVVRKRSDGKTAARYGKALDPHFHAQLIEFDQGKIPDYCDADTGWKSRRAR